MDKILHDLYTILRSARLVLWLPIMVNVYFLTISLHRSISDALIFGLSLSCIAAFGFLINDLWDLQLDKINGAKRLDTATEDVLRLAKWSAVLFLALGIALSAMFPFTAFLCILALAAGLTAYTFWIRTKLFLANLLAALLASSPLWAPNVAFMQLPDATQIGILAVVMLMLVGREVTFDIADHFGDAKMKRRTLPILLGDKIAQRMAVVMQLSGCVLLCGLTAIQARNLFFPSQLLLYVTCAAFALLIISINIRLLTEPIGESLKNIFVVRTRFAMLLIPILLFLLIHK